MAGPYFTAPTENPTAIGKYDPTGKTKLTPVKVNPPKQTPNDSSIDPFGGLTGSDRDAAVAIQNLFKSYGLDSLAPLIVKYIQQGYSADTISILLQDSSEYKQRFSANQARLKAGLPVLSPAEYISTENAYRQVMSAAGLPVGFYDSHADFQKFLEMDVSPTEVKSRVDAASEALNTAPKETLDYFKQFYNTGDLVAYALDPTKAAPLVEQRIKAAEAAALANQNNTSISQGTAELVGRQGASIQDMQAGFGMIGQESGTVSKLSSIYGGTGAGSVTADDLVKEVFTNDATATQKRKTLASRERAAFSGNGAQGKGSLSRDSGGAF